MTSVIPQAATVRLATADSARTTGAQKIPVETAVLAALAYSDLFDYPLTLEQIFRYQVGTHFTEEQIASAAVSMSREGERISSHGLLYALRGSEATFEKRKRREQASARVWRRAQLWGRFMARTPFVRCVAVTGALSMNNLSGRPDIDLLVITEPGRVWICRRLLILQVRIARLFGDDLCPNYILSARNLGLDQRDFFTAHELAQMVVLSGASLLHEMLVQNSWAGEYLPAAFSASRPMRGNAKVALPIRMLEKLLGKRLFDRWEAWELRRLRAKLSPLIGPAAEVICSPAQCKGHTGLHRSSVLTRYHERLRDLGIYEPLAILLDSDSC